MGGARPEPGHAHGVLLHALELVVDVLPLRVGVPAARKLLVAGLLGPLRLPLDSLLALGLLDAVGAGAGRLRGRGAEPLDWAKAAPADRPPMRTSPDTTTASLRLSILFTSPRGVAPAWRGIDVGTV
jgi:hypothetical protein